ncbi:MAG: dephospho-CoA kinase [Phycisphaerales bacterium]|nr:MAG: dephospho-CoA kinase [Phycisphaerales bacterium]
MILDKSKLIIGVAGGIGAGKTTVATILEDLGAVVIDSDKIARERLSSPEVVSLLRRWWGESICHPDGTVDRGRVAEIIFRDPSERSRLAAVIHPHVARRRRELLAVYGSDPAVRAIVIDSPLLFEAGLDEMCDLIVFVHAARAVRQARVKADRGWSEEEFARREKLQKPLDMKRQRADYIVVSNSELKELRRQVERLFSRVLHEAHRTR